jgi:hypothetical protein
MKHPKLEKLCERNKPFMPAGAPLGFALRFLRIIEQYLCGLDPADF